MLLRNSFIYDAHMIELMTYGVARTAVNRDRQDSEKKVCVV